MDFLSGLVWNIKIAAVLLFWYTNIPQLFPDFSLTFY